MISHNLLLTAIVVDDNKNIANVHSEYLEMLGVNVVSVGYDGKEAVELYKKYKPDILFLDLRMPQYDGIYALKEIRTFDPDAKVVIVTAEPDLSIYEELDHAKPTDVFFKPIDMKKMTALLDKIVHAKNACFIIDNEKKALVSFVITESLLKISQSTVNKVGDRLYAKHNCYFSDCLEHPEYLKNTLQEIFGNGSTAVIKTIREQLAEFEDQHIRNFLLVINK